MASSVSGQDKPNHALWLATGAGKMELSAHSGLPAVSNEKSFADSQILNLIFFLSFFFCEVIDLDSVSVHKHVKKMANIQSSWHHAWSITLIFILVLWIVFDIENFELYHSQDIQPHVEKNNEDEAVNKRQLNWDANSKLTVERVSLIEA